MTQVEIGLVAALSLGIIWFLVHRGRVKMELEVLHNRISALADEAKRKIDTVENDVRFAAKNAQGIASNALSSAQRAESKIAKHIDETVKTAEEIANA